MLPLIAGWLYAPFDLLKRSSPIEYKNLPGDEFRGDQINHRVGYFPSGRPVRFKGACRM